MTSPVLAFWTGRYHLTCACGKEVTLAVRLSENRLSGVFTKIIIIHIVHNLFLFIYLIFYNLEHKNYDCEITLLNKSDVICYDVMTSLSVQRNDVTRSLSLQRNALFPANYEPGPCLFNDRENSFNDNYNWIHLSKSSRPGGGERGARADNPREILFPDRQN